MIKLITRVETKDKMHKLGWRYSCDIVARVDLTLFAENYDVNNEEGDVEIY